MSGMKKIRGSISPLLAAMACTSLLLVPGITHSKAESAQAALTIAVKYDRRELTTRAGTEAVYARIKSAARKVCEQYEIGPIKRRTVDQKCYARSLDNAVAAVHQSSLTALHQSRANPNRIG
jgi:UrcA family protein